jgi:transcriptional regulator with XRE-family HTH domain
VPKQLPDRWRDLGAFIREQRSTSRLSLRRLSELAGISNPYLSQIERGLRRPSAEILQQIAKALRISAETLYVQAGILEPGTGETDLGREILADPELNEDQKQALIRIYLSFRHENEASREHGLAGDAAHGVETEVAGHSRPGAADETDPAGAGAGAGAAGTARADGRPAPGTPPDQAPGDAPAGARGTTAGV